MTEATEVETVTVEFEELKANIHRYYELKKTKRLVVMREGEQVSVVGPWRPHEGRSQFLPWFQLLYEMFPDPIDPTEREPGQRALRQTRGSQPTSIWTPRA